MAHNIFAFASESSPLGYLISMRKALLVLLVHKMRDSLLRLFLLKWAGALIATLSAVVFGFNFMPMYLAVGMVAPCVCLFLLLLWASTGDIFLKFALEDERFYLLALESRALDVFEDTELLMTQPKN